MHISYKPLWHTLLERDMRKEDLRLAAGMTTNMIANMSKGAWYYPYCPWGGCCPADGKAWYPDKYRQPEPGNQSCQPPNEVHPAAYPKPQRLDYRAGRKTEGAACTKSGGGSDTSSQSADEVYGDTKGRTEGLDKGWTEPGDFTGLKGSQPRRANP